MWKFNYPIFSLGVILILSCNSGLISKENTRLNADKSIFKNEIIAQLIELDNQTQIEADYNKYNVLMHVS